ncbi:bL17 family ribosomal protein [Mycoplasmopsis felis]|nr:bL17 family ribosomal protein [Mycoplasmopsis felis]MCU9934101.1 bL17 family ribosomal protein [Mycoplasmopsis felis]
MRSLVSELLAHGHIKTTLTRAKEVRRHAERMIQKAKNPTLANRRAVASYIYVIFKLMTKKCIKIFIWHNCTKIHRKKWWLYKNY